METLGKKYEINTSVAISPSTQTVIKHKNNGLCSVSKAKDLLNLDTSNVLSDDFIDKVTLLEETVSAYISNISVEEENALKQRLLVLEERRLKEWDNFQRGRRNLPTTNLNSPNKQGFISEQKQLIDTSSYSRPLAFFDITIGDTPAGRIIIELFDKEIPLAVENFCHYVSGINGYDNLSGVKLDYIDSEILRIVPGCEIQFDIEKLKNSLSCNTQKVKEERFFHRHTQRGLVSMISNGLNNVGPGFSFTLGPASHLDYRQEVIGRVLEGAILLDRIEAVPFNKHTGAPVVPIAVTFCGMLTGEKPRGQEILQKNFNNPTYIDSIKRYMIFGKKNFHFIPPDLAEPSLAPCVPLFTKQ